MGLDRLFSLADDWTERANQDAKMEIGGWLRSLGLEQYEAAFRDNAISEKVLPNLTAEDLKDLGIGMVGHRRMLLDAIAALRADTHAKAPTTEAPSTLPTSRLLKNSAAFANEA